MVGPKLDPSFRWGDGIGAVIELKANNLTCERGGRIVFTGVGFSLPGELMQLTGPSGSGK